ncbi:hypothetical protein [Burkholderia anthina]|uniref:hypothetical protein n=1 Tax=Burkholderia anthina TaxID=179879 RepID=UPI00158B2342|nr:hypothetical protein [Burkholderia anthina]
MRYLVSISLERLAGFGLHVPVCKDLPTDTLQGLRRDALSGDTALSLPWFARQSLIVEKTAAPRRVEFAPARTCQRTT